MGSAERRGHPFLGLPTWPQPPGEPARVPRSPAQALGRRSAHCSPRASALAVGRRSARCPASPAPPFPTTPPARVGSVRLFSASVPDDPSPKVPPPPPSPGAGASSSASGVAGLGVGARPIGAEVWRPVWTRAGGHGESGPRRSPHRLSGPVATAGAMDRAPADQVRGLGPGQPGRGLGARCFLPGGPCPRIVGRGGRSARVRARCALGLLRAQTSPAREPGGAPLSCIVADAAPGRGTFSALLTVPRPGRGLACAPPPG